MRILLWHGYLLGGTGSNVYTRMLAREWSNAGHEATVPQWPAKRDASLPSLEASNRSRMRRLPIGPGWLTRI